MDGLIPCNVDLVPLSNNTCSDVKKSSSVSAVYNMMAGFYSAELSRMPIHSHGRGNDESKR